MNTTVHCIRPLSDSETIPESAKEILGTRCRTNIDLYAEWAAVLGFPAWFGHNWGDFEDCLRHVTESPDGPVTIVLRNAAFLLEDEGPRELSVLLDILETTPFGLLLLDDSPCDLNQLARRMTAAGFTPPPMPQD
ncbi:MAG TPA: barstar family protein [Streptomyces sp.]